MKKTILLLIAMSFCFYCAAQDDLYYKSDIYKSDNNKSAGDYLVLSGKMQLIPVGIGAACYVGYKVFELTLKGQYDENSLTFIDKTTSFKKNAYLLTGASAVIFSYLSIHYKIQAGRKLNQNTTLNAYVNPSGVTLALNF